MKPLCIDLFCGLGGWAEGFLAEGVQAGRNQQWNFGGACPKHPFLADRNGYSDSTMK